MSIVESSEEVVDAPQPRQAPELPPAPRHAPEFRHLGKPLSFRRHLGKPRSSRYLGTPRSSRRRPLSLALDQRYEKPRLISIIRHGVFKTVLSSKSWRKSRYTILTPCLSLPTFWSRTGATRVEAGVELLVLYSSKGLPSQRSLAKIKRRRRGSGHW